MKILHIHDAPRILGGATVYLQRLVPELAARGHANAVFSLDEPAQGLPAETGCFQYERARSSLARRRHFGRFHRPLAEALEEFAGAFRPDLVHVQNFAPFRTTAFATLKRMGLPVLMTVHDYTLVDPDPPSFTRSGWKAVFMRGLDRSFVRRGQAAVMDAVSTFLCPTGALMSATPFPAGTAQLLRLPVERAEASPPPPGPLRLFFAGTLYHSKGIDLLLSALAAAGGEAAEARLEIAGAGDLETELKQQTQRLGLEERVRFLGTCNPEQMNVAYRAAALQVLPSRVRENSPLTVLEAGAHGRPAVASHSGGVPELLAPPDRGWTFPSEDAHALAAVLEEAAAAAGEREARGMRMREWVRHECDPAAHWDRLEAIYAKRAA